MSPQKTPVSMAVKKRGGGKTPSPGHASAGMGSPQPALVQHPSGAGRSALLASRTVKLVFLAALVTVTILLLSRTMGPKRTHSFERRPTSTVTSATPSASASASIGEEGGEGTAAQVEGKGGEAEAAATPPRPPKKQRERPPVVYSVSIVKEYDHDPSAFTQGLLHDKQCDAATGACEDIFYESTGESPSTPTHRPLPHPQALSPNLISTHVPHSHVRPNRLCSLTSLSMGTHKQGFTGRRACGEWT